VLTMVVANLVRDLCVLADKLKPNTSTDRGLTTLLPGEKHLVHLTKGEGIDPTLLGGDRVLHSTSQQIHLDEGHNQP